MVEDRKTLNRQLKTWKLRGSGLTRMKVAEKIGIGRQEEESVFRLISRDCQQSAGSI